MKNSKTTVTIRDIAKTAGVSIATVSRAINQSSAVSEETRKLVEKVVQQLGYRPNPSAQSLSKGSSRIITLLYDARMSQGSSAEHSVLWSQHASILSSGIQDTLIGTEYHLSVLAIPSFLHSAKETEIQDWLNRTNVTWGTDGLILTNPIIHDYLVNNIMHTKLPTVVVGKCPMSLQIPQIDIDNVEGFRILTMHVLSLGHRNVAFLGPDVDLTVHQDRMQGFRDAFTQSGIPLPRNWWLKTQPTDFVSSFRDARTRTLEAIDSGELPSCIMAFNDEMAYGVIQALVSRGLRVPQDVSVTGFDDLPSTVMFAPPLTTVRQDMRLIGQYAGRTLLRQIQDGKSTPSLIVLPVELVIRDSTAPI